MWYEPDADPASPWNDFNDFFLEKDFVWARQYVAQNADLLDVDDERVVFSGVSTGAIQSAFVAHASSAWDEAIYGGGMTLSAQSKQDTSVAAIVLFAMVEWMQVLPRGQSGRHWPLSSDPAEGDFYRGTPLVEDVDPALLRSDSPSTWIRTSQRKVPTFLVNGDGNVGLTSFARDPNGPAPGDPSDYDRGLASSPPCDPLLFFPFPSLNLHDVWHTIMFLEALLLADLATPPAGCVIDELADLSGDGFHELHSRAIVRADTTEWDRYPTSRTVSGAVPAPPTDPTDPDHLEDMETLVADLLLVDDFFRADCGGDLVPDPFQGPGPWVCGSVNNSFAARLAHAWLDEEVRPGVENVLMGANLDILRSGPARIGEPLRITVDMDDPSVDPRYTHVALWVQYDDPSMPFTPYPFGTGSFYVLCDIGNTGANFFNAFVPASGLFEVETGPIPRAGALVVAEMCAFACICPARGDGARRADTAPPDTVRLPARGRGAASRHAAKESAQPSSST